ncbi:MAG: 1-acyl-sn-glycerol-3-phosphate acyltransferase [Clostridia bacterium]|nr:1-acyl-sn-glycerol-3-phosphate acyltransferase [Clostridia bacterium]
MNALYAVLLFFVKIFYFICFPKKYHNKEKRPDKKASYLICANHVSAHDICFVAIGTKQQIHFIAKAEIMKNPILRFLAIRLGVIPIKRGLADTKALHGAIDKLKEGKVVCIFPQGTRHRDKAPEVSEFRSGAGMIAREAKCDILPVYIKPKNYRTKFFRRVDIYFGDMIKYEELGFEAESAPDESRFAKVNAATKLIAERICALNPDKKTEE